MNESEVQHEYFSLEKTLDTPAHISSLTFGHAGHLFAGSGKFKPRLIPIYGDPMISLDDGSLRVYDLSSYKVLKAARGLGAEVSSIVCVKKAGSDLRDAWIAHGRKVC